MADLVTILKKDHRRLDGLLDELTEASDADQEQLIDEIERAFEIHAELEESYVYPHVEDELGDEENQEAHTEHDLAREGIGRLRELAGQPGFGAMVEMVKAGIHHHVEEEERELLPQLKKSMGRDEWRRLSDEVAQHHDEANDGQMQRATPKRRRSSGDGATGTQRSGRSSASSSNGGTRSSGKTTAGRASNGSGRATSGSGRTATSTTSRRSAR